MNLIMVLPIIIPLLTGICMLIAGDRINIHRSLNVAGTLTSFIVCATILINVKNEGIMVTSVGNWPAPYGIIFVADMLSAIMLTISTCIGLIIAIYSIGTIDRSRESYGYYPFCQFLLMGVAGSFLTGDMFNLYVWFEIMLMSSFVLMALGGERAQIEGAVKYFTLNLISSFLFLTALGILYGKTGTLNMADLAQKLATSNQSVLIGSSGMLFLVAFGIKSAIFPLFFWLPASYHTPPVPVSSLFAGLLTKVGVYALIRMFTLLFIQDTEFSHTLLMIVAGFTMVTGVLGAAAQFNLRRLLSFHIISQIGYAVMGLALFTVDAISGAIYFLVHNIAAKTNLFLLSGIIDRIFGTEYLKQQGGLFRARPFLAILFLIPAMSLAGLPPLSGFFGKFALIKAGLESQRYLIVGVALAVGLLTLFSMMKIWTETFWKPLPDTLNLKNIPRTPFPMMFPIVLLAMLTVLMGIFPGFFFAMSDQAAEQLLNPSHYIQAVLGE